MNRKPCALAALLVATALLSCPLFAEEEASAVEENYTAIAMNMNAGPGPAAGRMTLRVRRWSTDEERSALLQILGDKGSADLVKALRKQPAVGNMNFTGSLGYELHYARATQQGETRHLYLATDRPIANVELRRGSRSMDYGITIVHLALGADGKGSGELLVGAELSLDLATHELTVEHLGTQPILLKSVELQKKKEKK